MIKAGVVGILGYVGEELIKILARHPNIKMAKLCDKGAGLPKPMREIYPDIFQISKLPCENLVLDEVAASCDIVFLALPHVESAKIAAEFLKKGKKVIDLSADFRLKDANIYENWYNAAHPHPSLLKDAVYGIPELYKDEIENASLIANPGCYPTTIILALAPLLMAKTISVDMSSIVVSSNSGVSGGGRNFAKLYFEKEHPNHKPYNIGGTHRHIPEIEQELARIAKPTQPLTITFSPHIIPVERGMLSDIYINLTEKIEADGLREIYDDFYKNKPFVKVLPDKKLPEIKNVVNTNFCEISVNVDKRTDRIVLMSAIDNLIKGAAGQAVQNMNIMFGFDESDGIL